MSTNFQLKMHKSEILKIANKLGEKYMSGSGLTDIERIVKDNGIPIINHFSDSKSPANLVCKDQKFYIILNTNPAASSDVKRQRFTIAHELGHYFIQHHKSELLQGNSLFIGEKFDQKTIKTWEREADEFAAKLLMPDSILNEFINESEITIKLIHDVSAKFQVSIECAALHLLKASSDEQILVKWRYAAPNYVSMPDNFFRKIRKIGDGKPEILQSKIDEVDSSLQSNSYYHCNETKLSEWFSNNAFDNYLSIFKAEAELNEGFGGMALLTRI